MKPKVFFIVGPTAVGKTDVSIKVAQKIKAEIISCDSMQVYREISIASNKPKASDLKIVPHHLINIISVKDEFDVSLFNQLALKALEDILRKNKVPVIVGGSGMYMQVLLDGIFEGASKDTQLREDLTAQANKKGLDSLYTKLESLDPEAAKNIHPNNLQRVIRALEVCLTQGKPFSVLKQKRKGIWGKYDIKIFALNRAREELYALINKRVDDMFKAGLVEEIKSILKLDLSPTAERIIGVREIKDYLEGKASLEDAKEKIKINTRHYAKRQFTWFRKDKRLEWIQIEQKDKVQDIVSQVLERIS
jgi:tRNA dimethylallyltransferase